MNAELRKILEKGGPVLPVLDVEWMIRGFDIGAERYAPKKLFADRQVSTLTVAGNGFAEIRYGAGLRGNTLVAARTVVKLSADTRLSKKLEQYDPRGSASTIYWASPLLLKADWEPLHVGIVEDWRITPNFTDLFLKTDDSVMPAQSPKPFFSKADSSSAADPSIWGVPMPLVLGSHSGFDMTGRGAITAYNVRYNDTLGYWYCASIGNVNVIRVYVDGIQRLSGFTIARHMFGGTQMTLIKFDTTQKPEVNAVVTCDVTGPDADGQLVGPTLKNPISLLRVYLNNYVFRDHRSGDWNPVDVFQIDTASWDAVVAYFDLKGYESGIKIGGARGDFQSAQAVIQKLLDSYVWLRIQWTETGKLTIFVIDHADENPAGNWVRADVITSDQGFVYTPGDRKEVIDRVSVPFLPNDSESKFMSTFEAHDLSLRYDPNSLVIENHFSQATYLQVP